MAVLQAKDHEQANHHGHLQSSAKWKPALIRFTGCWGYDILPILCFGLVYIAIVPSMADAQLRDTGPHDYPLGGADTDVSRRVERRRSGSPGDSPMDILMRLPAVVVLERIPVPSLAMARDGILLFANSAFAEMVGYRQDSLVGLPFAGDLPYRAGRGGRAFGRRCAGESGGGVAAW